MKVILPKFFYLQLEQPGLLGFGLGVLAPGLNIMGLCAITNYIFKLKLFFTIYAVAFWLFNFLSCLDYKYNGTFGNKPN